MLRGLSIFAGGCTLDAASRVVGADLDVLEGLLDKSLIRHTTDSLGADRYWMLETIRDFAGRRLEDAGESAPVFEAFRRLARTRRGRRSTGGGSIASSSTGSERSTASDRTSCTESH